MTEENKPESLVVNKFAHVAIIMDGNRRWATERGLPKLIGHTEGAKNLKQIAEAIKNRGVPYFTVYALSTENLKERSEKELKHLFFLFEQLVNYLNDFFKNNTRFRVIGDLAGLPETTQEKLREVIEKTKKNTDFNLTLAINYGGRDEIVRTVKKIIGEGMKAEDVTEEIFSNFLDTTGLPEVDLIIRTGARHRLSNFLPWQTTYAELYFTDTYWPAFTVKELDEVIEWFRAEKRTRGK